MSAASSRWVVRLAALVVAVGGGAVASAGESGVAARAAVAEGPFPTQRTDLQMFRPVGDALAVGGTTFAVERDDGGLRVDGTRVREADPVLRLEIGEGDGRRDVRVAFRRGDDGAWEWAVVEARLLEVDGVPVELIDADGDARYVVGADAYRLPPSRFLLPLTPVVVAGRSRLSIESISADGLRIEGVVEELPGSRHQLDGLVVVNELRVAHGLPPVVVDEELSAACSAHATFLVKNKWRPGKFNPHGEWRGGKGFSEEGHRAGMASVIAWSDHGDAARAYWDTYYHRFPLMHPGAGALGMSDGSPSVSVIDGSTRSRGADADGWRRPVCVPADGSVLETGAFHRGGESPEPVEQPGIRGFPLTVLFPGGGAGVTGFRARLTAIDRKGRSKDVPLLVPDTRSATDRFGAIPELPLRAGVDYVATYAFTRDGVDEELVVRFRVD